MLDFALEVPLYDVQITVLTPFPGTPLYARFAREGRMLDPKRWDLCTLFDVNFNPSRMTPEELRAGMRWLTRGLYSDETTQRRRQPFFQGKRAKLRRMTA